MTIIKLDKLEIRICTNNCIYAVCIYIYNFYYTIIYIYIYILDQEIKIIF